MSENFDPLDEFEHHEASSQVSSNVEADSAENLRLINRGSEQQRSQLHNWPNRRNAANNLTEVMRGVPANHGFVGQVSPPQRMQQQQLAP